MRRALLAVALIALGCAPAAQGSIAQSPWPPMNGPGHLFVHYGEEHWNDDDGLTLLPKVVGESIRFRPDLVTMSGDKSNDGRTDQLTRWLELMRPYDRAGIPFFAGTGNHDGKQPLPEGVADAGVGGSTPLRDIKFYRQVFIPRPYPFGDATPYRADPLLSPRTRPANDPPGASTHYSVDYGNVRFIFIDNSCYGIVNCDGQQSPALPDAEGNRTQYEYLERRAGEANRQGKLIFVVMHMPTRDPRDFSHSSPAQINHTMGKGASPDNQDFEEAAQRLGVDAVLLAHIKGQWLYRGLGGVPYFIDGGAGGELYTEGPVGADHGYWHGFRLLRVDGRKVVTDTVPIFVKDGIRIEGDALVNPGRESFYEAFGRQPVFKDPAKVEALELRDPDPTPRTSSSGGLLPSIGSGAWIFLPPFLLLALGLAAQVRRAPRLRIAVAGPVALALVGGLGGLSLAQRNVPTSTPRESLPTPARIFTTSNFAVLAPVAARGDDPRRDRRTQTEDGLFRARCAGRARVRVTSGFETSAKSVRVPSARGRIVRRARALGASSLRPGRRRTVARLRLAQPADVLVRVRRRGKTVRVLRQDCLRPGSRRLRVRWDGRVRRGKRLRAARPGRYRVQVRVRSDRRTVRRSAVVRIVRRG